MRSHWQHTFSFVLLLVTLGLPMLLAAPNIENAAYRSDDLVADETEPHHWMYKTAPVQTRQRRHNFDDSFPHKRHHHGNHHKHHNEDEFEYQYKHTHFPGCHHEGFHPDASWPHPGHQAFPSPFGPYPLPFHPQIPFKTPLASFGDKDDKTIKETETDFPAAPVPTPTTQKVSVPPQPIKGNEVPAVQPTVAPITPTPTSVANSTEDDRLDIDLRLGSS